MAKFPENAWAMQVWLRFDIYHVLFRPLLCQALEFSSCGWDPHSNRGFAINSIDLSDGMQSPPMLAQTSALQLIVQELELCCCFFNCCSELSLQFLSAPISWAKKIGHSLIYYTVIGCLVVPAFFWPKHKMPSHWKTPKTPRTPGTPKNA